MKPSERLQEVMAAVTPLDAAAVAEAEGRQGRLTKPIGALGRLEDMANRLAGIASMVPPPLPVPPALAIFAADHGVLAEGVSPWPAEVTGQMVANFCNQGAAVNVLARRWGASVVVVDVGVASTLGPMEGLVDAKVRRSSGNILVEDAMSQGEVQAAMDVGLDTAQRAIANGARCLLAGDMGIGNTTPSAALISAFTGVPPAMTTGRGTGIDQDMLAVKVSVVERALGRADLAEGGRAAKDPIGALAAVGGLEHAALVGYMIGGAAGRIPVVLDGVISLSAGMVAAALVPQAVGYWFAGHRPDEPGGSIALEHLGLHPVIDLGLRLGEGTGACLALPVLESSARLLGEMATFDSAGVTEKA